MNVAWVLGSRGLLGASLCRTLHRDGTSLFFPTEHFCWENGSTLASQLTSAIHAFAAEAHTADRWEIYWAAGVGTMSSAEDALAPETCALSLLIDLIDADPLLIAKSGAIAFSSSAGAIYANSADDIVTEHTIPTPTTAYARAKLKQEELVRSFANSNDGITALIARISTLYGPGQNSGKKQGLLTHMARSIVRNQPIQIYVPYDTIRDYIAADDAADEMVSVLRTASEEPCIITKIIASEQPVTIAEIISVFKRISRRKPRIVTSASRLSNLYSRRLQFHSITLPEITRASAKRIPVGIAQLMMAERAAFVEVYTA